MRYTQGAEFEPNYKELCKQLSGLLGCLLTRTGPVTLKAEDLALYKRADLIPCTLVDEDTSTLAVFLLSEEEFAEMQKTGKNPRES